MQHNSTKYLEDVVLAIKDIEEFSTGVNSFSEYQTNKILKSAIERKLLIIGEAVNKFRTNEKDVLIESADKIYGLRNRLAHAYDSIDDNTVYTILVRYIPQLKSEIETLLKDKK